MNNKAQVSLEYLLIFFIAIIIFTSITIPLIIDSFKTADDITDSIEAQNILNQLSNDVNLIYSSDYGSKKSRILNISDKMRITYKNVNNRKYLSTTIKLSDNSTKEIRSNIPCKVSFSNNPNYYYKDVSSNWLYNVEIEWINDTNGQKCVDINFKNYYK